MMQPLMEATQPSDRSFEIRKRGMEAMESYLAGTFSVFGKDHTIRPLARQAVNEDLEKAKELITEFCAEEYDSEPDFSDLRKVDIAYTTITDEEVPVQVSVDLMDFKLDRYIDGIIVDSRKYSSLKELTEQELTDPDFDELTAFSEEQLAKVALHGIQNKVVQRLTDNGEEIQIQLHVNGFYYNHYGMTDGTARYIDGPFNTLEDAAEEVHNYHPQAAQIADSVPDMEEDTFDDVDPQQVREELAKGGIVDGKLVDPEALENTPFIRQVIMGMHNYFQIATCVSSDFADMGREVDVVKLSQLKRKALSAKGDYKGFSFIEKKYGKSKQIRFYSGKPLIPVAYVKHKNPMWKKKSVCKYTPEGRREIHKNLGIDTRTMLLLMRTKEVSRSVEYMDNRISLYVAQYGKCAITGQILELHEIHCHHKKPVSQGGNDRHESCS